VSGVFSLSEYVLFKVGAVPFFPSKLMLLYFGGQGGRLEADEKSIVHTIRGVLTLKPGLESTGLPCSVKTPWGSVLWVPGSPGLL
jgi:hypothetical protein